MKSPLPLPPAAGQQPGTVPAVGPAMCRYPGCGNPARTRPGDGPAPRPATAGRRWPKTAVSTAPPGSPTLR